MSDTIKADVETLTALIAGLLVSVPVPVAVA